MGSPNCRQRPSGPQRSLPADKNKPAIMQMSSSGRWRPQHVRNTDKCVGRGAGSGPVSRAGGWNWESRCPRRSLNWKREFCSHRDQNVSKEPNWAGVEVNRPAGSLQKDADVWLRRSVRASENHSGYWEHWNTCLSRRQGRLRWIDSGRSPQVTHSCEGVSPSNPEKVGPVLDFLSADLTFTRTSG